MVLDELAKHFLVRRHAAGYTRGLQAWERPDFENKHRLALLTSAGFGSGWLPCSSLFSLCEWKTLRRGGQPGRGPQLWL